METENPRDRLKSKTITLLLVKHLSSSPSTQEIWSCINQAVVESGDAEILEYFNQLDPRLSWGRAFTEEIKRQMNAEIHQGMLDASLIRLERLEAAVQDVLEIIKPWIMDDPNMAGIYEKLKEALKK